MRLVLIDFRQPFFRPITRRIVIFALVAIWTVVEFFVGSLGWVIFFAALTAYVGWGFFLSGQPDEPEAENGRDDAPPPSSS
jgi:phage-related holin